MSLQGSSVIARDNDHNDDDDDDNTNDDEGDGDHNDEDDDNTNGDDCYESKVQGNQTVWLTEACATRVLTSKTCTMS